MAEVALVVLAAGVGARFGGVKQLTPVGPGGEAVMDYSIHAALVGGLSHVVVVVRPELDGPVRRHLARTWEGSLDVDLAHQPLDPATGKPAGTVPAVLAARAMVGGGGFAVVNADDLYPVAAFDALYQWLAGDAAGAALVGFPLAGTILPAGPATGPVRRAVCDHGPDGTLTGLVEAEVEQEEDRYVARPLGGGGRRQVDGGTLVSMNAWGFRPSIWPELERAAGASTGTGSPAGEVLLPTVVSGLIGRIPITVLPTGDPCPGITWPGDVEAVRAAVLELVGCGRYPRRLRPPT